MIVCRSPVELGPPWMRTLRGIGYGPGSDRYWNVRCIRRCLAPTTLYGMPIGAWSRGESPEPNEGSRVASAPIAPIITAELAATGSLSTRVCQGLFVGNSGHRGACGRPGADAEASSNGSASTATSLAAL